MTPERIVAIKRLQHLSCDTLMQSAQKMKILDDCRNLSSGTIATLTGKNQYSDIDSIQRDFCGFADAAIPKRRWESWVDAWNEYKGLANGT